MEDAAAVLLGFPPPELSRSDLGYNGAIRLHSTKVTHLLNNKAQIVQNDNAVKLLQLLDPAVNSLSYLVVLDSLKGYDGISAEDRAVATIQFFTSFDARQIRYAGDTFLSYLRHMASDRFILPYDVKVGLLATAILRLDPTGSMLTTAHIDLVQLAYQTDTAEYAFPVIDKQIVYYPGMDKDNNKNQIKPDVYLCDMSISAPDYITEETGFIDPLNPPSAQSVLEYDYTCGLLYSTRRQWKKARDAFERVVTHPTRDGGLSKVMTEAYDKWLLVSLLVNGRTPPMPANVASHAKNSYETTGKAYHMLAAHFDTLGAVELKQEVDTHALLWHEDHTSGLVQEVLASHQKWQVMGLRNVFSKVSISYIRENTRSAETGNALPSDDDVEKLVQGMIDSKMLNGVIVKPEGKAAYLEYLSEVEELSESEYKREVAGTFKKLKELEVVFQTTNARLSTNPYWLKHVVREQKREKDNSALAGFHLSQESALDDEDLMTDVKKSAL